MFCNAEQIPFNCEPKVLGNTPTPLILVSRLSSNEMIGAIIASRILSSPGTDSAILDFNKSNI